MSDRDEPATLVSLLEEQHSLIAEAAEALPHQFSTCTYALGALRQAVYLCLTCTPPDANSDGTASAGVCAACSIACHAEHEQVELFPKRGFTCDCPTCALPGVPCTLNAQSTGAEKMPRNEGNVYGQNYRGVFCRCGRVYEAEKEKETMIQCIACEDWFHESCLGLRERPPSRSPTPQAEPTEPTPDAKPESDTVADGNEEAQPDDSDDDDDDGLPPPLLSGSAYETLMCGSCVARTPVVRRWAGTPGVMLVVRPSPSDTKSHTVIGRTDSTQDDQTAVDVEGEIKAGTKRPRSPASELQGDAAKRARAEASEAVADASPAGPSNVAKVCLAPPANASAQKLLDAVEAASTQEESERKPLESEGDVFFSAGWRERWCRCSDCLPELEKFPWLLEEEETYEAPEDPDSGLSLEELGMRALERLPRDRAIDGLMAYRDMRDDLMAYLRPFAEQGRVVEEGDIGRFFEARREAREAQARKT